MALTRITLLAPSSVGSRALSSQSITSEKLTLLNTLSAQTITCFQSISCKGEILGTNVLDENRLSERIFTASVIFG